MTEWSAATDVAPFVRQPHARQCDVLVVGAGPTGLALAAALHAGGAAVRVIDQNPRRVRESRALAVQPRTLEVLSSFGLADELVRRGNPAVERATPHRLRRALTRADDQCRWGWAAPPIPVLTDTAALGFPPEPGPALPVEEQVKPPARSPSVRNWRATEPRDNRGPTPQAANLGRQLRAGGSE